MNARKDMNSDVGALYIESLTDVIAIHASRVALAIHTRIPEGIWLTLLAVTVLGMIRADDCKNPKAPSHLKRLLPTPAFAFSRDGCATCGPLSLGRCQLPSRCLTANSSSGDKTSELRP
jgi:hypothetical protein